MTQDELWLSKYNEVKAFTYKLITGIPHTTKFKIT